MDITTNLKKRFCKDANIPINLYQEPYFTERLKLFEKQFQAKSKWNIFRQELKKFKNEQEYFEYYNKVKDNVINHIKCKKEYETFITYDMNKFTIPNYSVGRKSVFKEDNINKNLISIDLTKANYNAMKYFNNELVDNTNNYEEFISNFTDSEHIKNSKYIRQVVFGNCNPKRQTTIEKFMMNILMEELLKYIDIKYIQTFTTDEIVFKYNSSITTNILQVITKLYILAKQNNFKIHCENYKLKKIPNTDFYIKKLINGEQEFKCVNTLFYPIILRKYNNEKIRENDLIFFHEGYLSKFVQIPEIEVI